MSEDNGTGSGDGGDGLPAQRRDREALYDQAVVAAIDAGRVSTSFIQRTLQIGYVPAAAIIKKMEARGVVGKPDQLGKRQVLVTVPPASRVVAAKTSPKRRKAPAAPAALDPSAALWTSALTAAGPREGFAGEGGARVAAALAGARLFAAPAPHPTGLQAEERGEPSQEGDENGEGSSLSSDADNGGGGDAGARRALVDKLVLDRERLEAAAREPLNDVGNAARMKLWFGADLFFVRDVGWHYWAGTHWELKGGDEYALRMAQMIGPLIIEETDMLSMWPHEDRAIEREAEALERIDAERKADPKAKISADDKVILAEASAARASFLNRKKGRRDYGKSSGNGGKITNMIEQLKPHVTVTVDQLDGNPMALNVLNGTLHFSKVQLDDWEAEGPRWKLAVDFRPHARGDYITKMSPVAYQPDYVSPLWSAFIERFLPETPIREYVQTFHGLGITGLRVQALIYHYGKGANGKSVAIETMAQVLGQYLQMLPVEAVSGDGQRRGDQATPEFARLPGARVVRVSELPEGFKLKEALIKALTGGEPILARHLNKGFFEFQPVFKPVLSSNHKPEIYGTDHGIWRRMNLVPWTVTIPEAEQRSFDDVVAEMVAEGSGVLNWLIEGLGRYIGRGLVAPSGVKVATAEHRSDMDPIGRFVEHCVGILTLSDDCVAELAADEKAEPPEAVRVYAREMHQAFNRWMEANGAKPWGETAFGRKMGERAEQFGFKRYDKRVRYFAPVSLHDVPEAVEGQGHSPASRHRMTAPACGTFSAKVRR